MKANLAILKEEHGPNAKLTCMTVVGANEWVALAGPRVSLSTGRRLHQVLNAHTAFVIGGVFGCRSMNCACIVLMTTVHQSCVRMLTTTASLIELLSWRQTNKSSPAGRRNGRC